MSELPKWPERSTILDADMDELTKHFKSQPREVVAPKSCLEPIPQEGRPCDDKSHFPPNYICILYGMQHRHVCPTCGHESITRSTEVRF